jgi:hypothetical protein
VLPYAHQIICCFISDRYKYSINKTKRNRRACSAVECGSVNHRATSSTETPCLRYLSLRPSSPPVAVFQSPRSGFLKSPNLGLTNRAACDGIFSQTIRIGSIIPCFAIWQILKETVPRPHAFSSNPIAVFLRFGCPFCRRARAYSPEADSYMRGCCCRGVHGCPCWFR